jgi:hypothetical protein
VGPYIGFEALYVRLESQQFPSLLVLPGISVLALFIAKLLGVFIYDKMKNPKLYMGRCSVVSGSG